MSQAELLRAARVASQMTTTRIRRLEAAGMGDSPALSSLHKSMRTGDIDSGTSRAALISQIRGAQQFGRSQMSTVSGYREVIRQAADALAEATGKPLLTKTQSKRVTMEKVRKNLGSDVELVYTKGGDVLAKHGIDKGEISLSDATRMWKMYHEMQDAGEMAQFSQGSPPGFQAFFDEFQKDPDRSAQQIVDAMVEEYEKEMKREASYTNEDENLTIIN